MDETQNTQPVETQSQTAVTDDRGPVPYDRFAQVVHQKKELEQKLSKLQESEQIIAGLQGRIREIEQTWQQKEQTYLSDIRLMEAGLLDSEGRDIARFVYR